MLFLILTAQWIPEIQRHCPGVPFILVGLKADLREDDDTLKKVANEPTDLDCQLAKLNLLPISAEQGKKCAAKYKAAIYVECSALTQAGLRSVVDAAVAVVVERRRRGSERSDGFIARFNRRRRERRLAAAAVAATHVAASPSKGPAEPRGPATPTASTSVAPALGQPGPLAPQPRRDAVQAALAAVFAGKPDVVRQPFMRTKMMLVGRGRAGTTALSWARASSVMRRSPGWTPGGFWT